jgi:hypothetical protein
MLLLLLEPNGRISIISINNFLKSDFSAELCIFLSNENKKQEFCTNKKNLRSIERSLTARLAPSPEQGRISFCFLFWRNFARWRF